MPIYDYAEKLSHGTEKGSQEAREAGPHEEGCLADAEGEIRHPVHMDEGHEARKGQVRHKGEIAGITRDAREPRVRPLQGGEAPSDMHEDHREVPSGEEDQDRPRQSHDGLAPAGQGKGGDGGVPEARREALNRIREARADKEDFRGQECGKQTPKMNCCELIYILEINILDHGKCLYN